MRAAVIMSSTHRSVALGPDVASAAAILGDEKVLGVVQVCIRRGTDALNHLQKRRGKGKIGDRGGEAKENPLLKGVESNGFLQRCERTYAGLKVHADGARNVVVVIGLVEKHVFSVGAVRREVFKDAVCANGEPGQSWRLVEDERG